MCLREGGFLSLKFLSFYKTGEKLSNTENKLMPLQTHIGTVSALKSFDFQNEWMPSASSAKFGIGKSSILLAFLKKSDIQAKCQNVQ